MSTMNVESYVLMMKEEFPRCPICDEETEYTVWRKALGSGIECKHCGARWTFYRNYDWKGQDKGLAMVLVRVGKFNVTAEIMSLLNARGTPISKWKTLASVTPEKVVSSVESLTFQSLPFKQGEERASFLQAAIFEKTQYWEGDKKVLSSLSGDMLVTQTDVRFIRKGPFLKDNKKLLKKFVTGELDANSDDYIKFVSRINNPIIHIPVNRIDIEGLQYNTLVDVKRKGVSLVTGIWGAGGETRTAYFVLTIPYLDKDDVHQSPKFFVDQQEGKQLHKEIYDKALKVQKSESGVNLQKAKSEKSAKTGDDALKLLKIRLAKGEINTQEYEEMKRLIEQ